MKRIISIILLIIVLINASAMFINAEDIQYNDCDIITDNRFFNIQDFKTYLGISDTELTSLVNDIQNGIKTHTEIIYISKYNIKFNDNSKKALMSIIYNMYSTFEISNSYAFSYSSLGTFTAIRLRYLYTVQETEIMKNEIESVCDELLQGIRGNTSLSDETKALLVHDRLIVHTEYAKSVLKDPGTASDLDYTVYGALVNKECVCEGYARAYSYLLSKIGIYSYLNVSNVLNHAWNIVYINDKPFHVDVTFDDPSFDISGRVCHDFFLVSDNTLYNNRHHANDYIKLGSTSEFENSYWNHTQTQVVLINDCIYYYNNDSQELLNYTNGQVIYSNEGCKWMASATSYYLNDYSKLGYDSIFLFLSTNNKILRINTTTNSAEEFYVPTINTVNYSIFGFKVENGFFYLDLYSSPNFNENTKRDNQEIYYYLISHDHDWILTEVINDSTLTTNGSGIFTCSICSITETKLLDLLEHWKKGDLNNDSKLNSQDANMIIDVILGTRKVGEQLIDAADLNSDNRVNAVDANLLDKAIVGQ